MRVSTLESWYCSDATAVRLRREFRPLRLGVVVVVMISPASGVWDSAFDDLSLMIFRQPTNLKLIFNQMQSSSVTSMAKREARSQRFNCRGTLRLGYNCPHYWVNYCPRNEGVNPYYEVFLGEFLPPETSINSPV